MRRFYRDPAGWARSRDGRTLAHQRRDPEGRDSARRMPQRRTSSSRALTGPCGPPGRGRQRRTPVRRPTRCLTPQDETRQLGDTGHQLAAAIAVAADVVERSLRGTVLTGARGACGRRSPRIGEWMEPAEQSDSPPRSGLDLQERPDLLVRHGDDQIGGADHLAGNPAGTMRVEVHAMFRSHGGYRIGHSLALPGIGTRRKHLPLGIAERSLQRCGNERTTADVAGADHEHSTPIALRRDKRRRGVGLAGSGG